MNDIYKTTYLGKPVNPIDCNNCNWLNITEEEQEKMKGLHICKFYNRILKHRTSSLEHNPRLYPCDECYKENNKHFAKRVVE